MKTSLKKLLAAIAVMTLAMILIPTVTGSRAYADVIQVVSATGIDAPVAGKMPDYDVTAYSSDARYNVSDPGLTHWKNGVLWRDEDSGLGIKSTDRFISGHQYTVIVQVGAKSGHTFASKDNMAAFLNGNGAEVYRYDDTHVGIKYTFPRLPAASVLDSAAAGGIDAPAIGKTPDYNATVGSNVPYEIKTDSSTSKWKNGVLWRDEDSGLGLNYTDTFLPGHRYTVIVEIKTLSGIGQIFDLAENLKGTLNGQSAKCYRYADNRIGICYTFPRLPNAVTSIQIVALDAPAVGKTPDYDISVSGENIRRDTISSSPWRNGVVWRDLTIDDTIRPTDTFQESHQYRVRISLYANDGYTFLDGNGKLLPTVKVNGQAVTTFHAFDQEGKNIGIDYVFPKLGGGVTKAGNAVITGIVAPQAGKTPDYTASVSGEGLSWESDYTDDHSWKNGIEWYDITKGEDLYPTDTFVEGHAYRVRISLIVADGYTATEGTSVTISGTINGNPAKSVYWKDTNIGFAYDFPAISAEHLFPVDFYGFAPYGGGLFLVYQGDVLTEANGLVQDPNNPQTWYFCANGQAQLQYTGLAEYNGAWFYLENGICDTNRLGIVSYNGGRFVVSLGRWVQEYSGLFQDPVTKKWYFVAAGQVQDHYTGLAQYDGAWFYLIKGELAETYTGPVEYNGSTFNVVAGMVQ